MSYILRQELHEICKPASSEKGKHQSIIDGVFASIKYKESQGLELTLSEVLKSIFNTLQMQRVTVCPVAINAMYSLLEKVDENYRTDFTSQVPGFPGREGKFCFPALILEKLDDPKKRWTCTPVEREMCGYDTECMQWAAKLNQKIEYFLGKGRLIGDDNLELISSIYEEMARSPITVLSKA